MNILNYLASEMLPALAGGVLGSLAVIGLILLRNR